jgi:hypothetical protein
LGEYPESNFCKKQWHSPPIQDKHKLFPKSSLYTVNTFIVDRNPKRDNNKLLLFQHARGTPGYLYIMNATTFKIGNKACYPELIKERDIIHVVPQTESDIHGAEYFSPYFVWHFNTGDAELYNLDTEKLICKMEKPYQFYTLNDSYVYVYFHKNLFKGGYAPHFEENQGVKFSYFKNYTFRCSTASKLFH